jgi:superfamily II DNA or RNA helicase
VELQIDKLRPHQIEPARHLVKLLTAGQNCVDISDTGTGKTYVACAVSNALQLPTLVVCPKIVVSKWGETMKQFGDTVSVIGYEKLRMGTTPFGWWEKPRPADYDPRYYVCQSCQREVKFETVKTVADLWCEPCAYHPRGIHCIDTKRRPWDLGKWIWSPNVGMVIFDEAHRCEARDSLHADMMIGCRRYGIPTLALSATLASSPLHMRALGFVLGLHNLVGETGFFPWSAQRGCGLLPGLRGWRWKVGAEKQIKIMRQLRAELIPSRGVRVSCKEIPDFPEREITSELYDIDDPDLLNTLYERMRLALDRHERRKSLDKSPDGPLSKVLRARQKIELLKVPVAAELANDYLEKGYSVCIFVNYRDTITELERLLKTDCIIDGSEAGVRNRLANIRNFQSNASRLILVNSAAGGVALELHDTDGNFPRVGLVFPDYSANKMKQLFGRLQRDGGKSKCHYRVILAAGTIETSIHKQMHGRWDNIEALNDADFLPAPLQYLKGVVPQLSEAV